MGNPSDLFRRKVALAAHQRFNLLRQNNASAKGAAGLPSIQARPQSEEIRSGLLAKSRTAAAPSCEAFRRDVQGSLELKAPGH